MDESLQLMHSICGRAGNVILTLQQDNKALLVDKIDISKSDARSQFLSRCCEQFPGLDRSQFDRCLLDVAAEVAQKTSAKGRDDKAAAPATAPKIEIPEDLRREAEAMLDDPGLMDRIIDDVAALGVAGERNLIAATYLCGTSRLLKKPVSLIVQGPSSSGKSYVIDKVASCFPPESVIAATQLTSQALFYMQPGSLCHKFVVVGERSRLENDDTAEATRALREMLSSGRLSKLVPVKGADGQMRTMLIEQDGPIAYIESTTLTQVFDEDANRSILISTDERSEQTHRIIKHVATSCSGITAPKDRESTIALHHAAQRILEQCEVVVPFAPMLADLFKSRRIEARRAFPHLISLIQTSAMLHQRQRQRNSSGDIVATVDDYRIAKGILNKPLLQQLGGGLSNATERFLERMSESGALTFTTTDASRRECRKFSARSVRGWLHEAFDAGRIEMLSPAQGPRPAKWQLLHDIPIESEPSILPHEKLLLPDVSGSCQQGETSNGASA